MNRIGALAAGMTLAFGLATSAAASVVNIDFDDAPGGGPVDTFYAAEGVEFLNTEFTDNFHLDGTSGDWGIRATGTFAFSSSNPIQGFFNTAGGFASTVTIRGIDIGYAGARLDAYNDLNQLVGSATLVGVLAGVGNFGDLTVTASNIERFELYQPFPENTGDGVLFDNLSFDLQGGGAPEPATWGLMIAGFGLAGVGLRRRRAALV